MHFSVFLFANKECTLAHHMGTKNGRKEAANQFGSTARFTFLNRDWDQQAQRGDI